MVDFLAHWQGIQLIDLSHISNIHLLKFIDTARQRISLRVRIGEDIAVNQTRF